MQNQHQNPINNLNNPLQLESEQVIGKAFPIKQFGNEGKPLFQYRRSLFKNIDDVMVYICDVTGAEAYFYQQRGKFAVAAFNSRSKKPIFHFLYHTEADCIEVITTFFLDERNKKADRHLRRLERSNYVNQLVVGDILYTSWGYDQTNVDYYQITRVLNKKIGVRPIRGEYFQVTYMSGDSVPVPNQFIDEEFIVRTCSSTNAMIEGHHASLVKYQLVDGVKVYQKQHESSWS